LRALWSKNSALPAKEAANDLFLAVSLSAESKIMFLYDLST